MRLNQFFIWLSRRSAPIALLIVIVSVMIVIQILVEKINHPKILHTINPTETNATVIWSNDELSDQMIASGNMLLAVTADGDELIAYDLLTRKTVWKTNRPSTRPGARGLVVYENMIFLPNSVAVDAYNLTSGELVWTIFLGDGHVDVILQIDGEILRVYYGDYIYQIDPSTGAILSKTNKEKTLWTVENILFRKLGDYEVEAVDDRTGRVLWKQGDPFFVGEERAPQKAGDHTLVVSMPNNGICSLSLENGYQNWCSREIYISNVALDFQSMRAYVLREDISLVVIDLLSGAILREIDFSTNIENDDLTYGKVGYSGGVIIVYFADSGQTFGLLLKQ
ncbi:MAG: PQQ-binding-like beta-propeller repeat protein [Anaerolineales bacterium]|nr:PQQ-binding-like beta-propeller repeat protein [Anaerolineales bacterium]